MPLSSRDERWKPVRGFEGFFSVSDAGRVRSETRTILHKRHGVATYRGRMIEPTRQERRGTVAYVVTLTRDGKGTTFAVHRLVAEAFVANPGEHPIVIHLDGDAKNNSATNLAWASLQESSRRAYLSGRKTGRVGEQNGSAILTEDAVRQIRELLRHGDLSQRQIADRYGVVPMVITDIKKGRTWKHVI